MVQSLRGLVMYDVWLLCRARLCFSASGWRGVANCTSSVRDGAASTIATERGGR